MAQDVKEENKIQTDPTKKKKGFFFFVPHCLHACMLLRFSSIQFSICYAIIVLLLNLERHVAYSTKYIDVPGS